MRDNASEIDEIDEIETLTPGEREEIRREHRISLREYNQSWKARLERRAQKLPERVFVHRGYIRFIRDSIHLGKSVDELEGCTYDIPLSSVDTPEKILSWIAHLSQKTWMKREMLGMFVEKACWKSSVQLPTAC